MTDREGFFRMTDRGGYSGQHSVRQWELLQSVNIKDSVKVVDFVLEDDGCKTADRFSDGFYRSAAISATVRAISFKAALAAFSATSDDVIFNDDLSRAKHFASAVWN